MVKDKIPKTGIDEKDLFEYMENSMHSDIDWRSGKTFGAVYYPGEKYSIAISNAYTKYMHENAFDPQLFSSILTMENELVQQTASLFSSNQKLFGNLTSGGTESIFLSVLSARNWSNKQKTIKNPEVILSSSAHPAFLKAMNFLKIKPVIVPTNKDFNLNLNGFKEAINQNTILLVASAPAYPTGMIDPISELSNLALENKLLLHVDACIGGFLLSYLKKCNYNIPPFDFNLDGVSSLSVDLHKYAYAPKGSSVLLYRNDELRKQQFSVYPNWEGGIYGSTSFLGTKPGGIVAASWFALNHIGENGYIELTQKTMSATKVIYDFIQNSEHLSLIGNPIMSLIAFHSEKYDIYHIADELSNLGWYIGRLQNPRGIHLVVSQIHADGAAENFIADLQSVLKSLSSSEIKNKIFKTTDALAVNALKKAGYNSIKKTILGKTKSNKKSKKRLIYDLKSDLNLEESDDLFRSILSNLY
ncbi:MAG: pyridoxal phosphate-dependent decarboxylase family protein [Parvicellaceae bacterium]